MGKVELKSSIHKIVDEIQNEEFLHAVYNLLKSKAHNKPGQLWDTLTAEQQQEVLLAFEESEDEGNLLDRNQVFPSK